MSRASREIARRHPLVPRTVGVVEGRVLVARSNWDILEVRDLFGELVMRHEIALEGEALLGAVAFAGPFIVVEQSGGITALGARVWSLVQRRWCASVERVCSEIGLIGAGPGWFAIADLEGVDVIDPADGSLLRRFSVAGAASLSLHPARPEVWVIIGDGDGARSSVALIEGTAVRRTRDLVEADARAAWIDGERILVASPRGSLSILDGELRECGSLPGLDVDLTSVEVTGQWTALLTPYGESALLDLETGAHQRRKGICFVEPDGKHVIWADEKGTERRPI